MKKRQNISQGAIALRSTISVMLMLVSAVLLSLAASSAANRVGHNGSERTEDVKASPGWNITGSLTNARQLHTATLLPNGKVLVAGGHSNGSAGLVWLSSAELYDPATGAWSFTGSLGIARYGHTATLLPSGKVLVVGGVPTPPGFLSSAELYDPATTIRWSKCLA